MKNILVTGGAGYIGSILVRLLLAQGYHVRVLDRLMFGGESIIELLNNDNFDFIKGDIRNSDEVRKALPDIDAVVHLAAIVGDPACAKEPELTKETNLTGSKLLYEEAEKSGAKRFVFASTCSNYGKMKDPSAFVNEGSDLAPVSLYARTKVEFEKYLLGQPKTNSAKPTCLRFATVYGPSPRIRFDLTVNEFAKDSALGRELVVFGEQFWRPYCHVVDLARSAVEAIKADESKVAFKIFNVGDTEENYRKQMIVDEILKQIPDAKIRYVQKDEDPRDYRVSFAKIQKELGFKITKTVPDGIRDMIKIIKDQLIPDPDDGKYKNV